MKKIFIILFLGLLLASCATTHESVLGSDQVNNIKPALTREAIASLESSEEAAAETVYQSNIFVQARDTARQKRVTNVYVDMRIRDILMDMATQANVVISIDNAVEGTTSITLKDTPIENAFEMVLFPGGYNYRWDSKTKCYLIGKSLPENTSFDKLTTTTVIKTNRGADKVISQLSLFYQPFVKADGQTITITATPDIINRLQHDIALIDRSKRMIEISAQFVMVEWEKGKNLGVKWNDLNLSGLGIADIIKGGASALTANLAASLTSVLSANGFDTKIKSMAEPRIVVEEGEKADINITEKHLFLILSGGGANYNYFTTKDVEVGIKLKVQPFVTRDGQIRIAINPEVSDIIGEREFKQSGGPSQLLPIIASRSTETILKVANGETIAIGGLITKVEQTKRSGIPFFRNIPLVGPVFGNKDKSAKETELVIFITSKIIG